jgi:hypothetical protein
MTTASATSTQPSPYSDSSRDSQVARSLSIQQEQLVRAFAQYGIQPRQISFDIRGNEPVFDFNALSVLSMALAPDIVSMETEELDRRDDYVSLKCRVILKDGRSRAPLGLALIGEVLPDNTKIVDYKQAFLVAQSRAARAAFRAVGFNPVQAHERRMRGEDLALDFNTDPRAKDLATIHLLADEAGLITEVGDDTAYRKHIGDLFADDEGRPITSARNLDDKQRSQLIASLRSMKALKERVLGTANGRGEAALAANANAAR